MKAIDTLISLIAAVTVITMMTVMFLSIGIEPMIPSAIRRQIVNYCIVVLAVSACYGAARAILEK